MRQLLLNLEAPKPPSLETFVTGRNGEAAALLRTLKHAQSAGTALPLDQRFVYLWGQAGAGKTHLLKALATAPHARYLAAPAMPDAGFDPAVHLYLLDNCQHLAPDGQIAAFALFNQVREHGAALVVTGDAPPAQLLLREDLRTRLGWGLIYQIHELSDAEKIAALTLSAGARGLPLSPGVLPYLMTHFQRDMASLSAMLDALDRYSLETQRPLTLPLLRDLLQRQGDTPA